MSRLERDGVGLHVEESGSGPAELLLVHGIACDHRYMAPQLDHFSRHGRVVAVDLRGHGGSDALVSGYAVHEHVDDLAWLCGRLGLQRPAIVGHSLGGVMAVALAARHPELPAAVVALDSPLVPPPERADVMRGLFPRLRGPAYAEELRAYFSAFFLPTDDPARREWIMARITDAPAHAVIATWEQAVLGFDAEAATAACRVRLLYVDAGTPNTDLARLAALPSRPAIGRTVGAGHFHQLEVPDQVNAMIERFLALLPGAAPGR